MQLLSISFLYNTSILDNNYKRLLVTYWMYVNVCLFNTSYRTAHICNTSVTVKEPATFLKNRFSVYLTIKRIKLSRSLKPLSYPHVKHENTDEVGNIKHHIKKKTVTSCSIQSFDRNHCLHVVCTTCNTTCITLTSRI